MEEITASFVAGQVSVDDLPADDPAVRIGRECSALFTNGVGTLRDIIPNERIRSLARVLWDVVGSKYVLVAMGPKVPSLAFTVMRMNGVMQGIVLIPQDWAAQTEKDVFMQLGAILFTGAQVVDYYNDRLLEPTAKPRWYAYEAELLRTLRGLLPDWQPNEYQTEALKKYPDGLDTKGIELYTLKPFEARASS